MEILIKYLDSLTDLDWYIFVTKYSFYSKTNRQEKYGSTCITYPYEEITIFKLSLQNHVNLSGLK